MDTLDKPERTPQPDAKRGGDKPVLRARPPKGRIDREALRRRIIARFPKILTELAK